MVHRFGKKKAPQVSAPGVLSLSLTNLNRIASYWHKA